MEINIKELKKWIVALDSGEFGQFRGGALQSNKINERKPSCCCLGVGCRVIIPANKLKTVHGILVGGLVSSQPYAPEWLKEINILFYNKTGESLVSLNDSAGFSFTEIATLLELVFIHKILD